MIHVSMNIILGILLIIIMFILAIIISILAEHKEEIWDCIIFEEEDKNE